MARLDQVTMSRDRKLQTILEFATELPASLSSTRSAQTDDLLLADIKQHTKTAVSSSQDATTSIPSATAKSLEKQGRELWNLCIRIKRQSTEINPQVLVRTRVFAFTILCLGRKSSRKRKKDGESEAVYLMELALTLARICMEAEDMIPARDALHKAAECLEQLKTPTPGQKMDQGRVTLEADYLAMRMALSWRENCLDVAEHMFTKTEALRPNLDVRSAEMMADTLRHIGADLFSKKDYPLAIKWLKRAYDIFNSQDIGIMSMEGLESRTAICHSLIRSLLGVGSPESINEADSLVAYVESEIGDKPVVLHWRLEILQTWPGETFDIGKYSSILRRMIRMFEPSAKSFDFLLHHIKELRKKSSKLAIALIDEFLTQQLLKLANKEWLSKAVVTRIWMSTVEGDLAEPDGSNLLTGVLDTVSDAVQEPLSPDAAGAAHSLIWKKVEAAIMNQQHEIADTWCLIALHEIFCSSGAENLAKFGRKQLLCALSRNDADKARAVFARMPDPARDDLLTRYLMFKVSLLDWDHQLGIESIEYLGRATDDGYSQEILYACIKDAQQVGDKMCTLAALKATVDKWNSGKASAASLPSVIRCSIRLINMIEEQERKNKGESSPELFVDDLCTMFERAAEHAKRKPRDWSGNIIFTVPELTWFRKNAYNIGAKKADTWNLTALLRMFIACIDFISCYPTDLPRGDAQEISLMAMRCHFIVAAALVSLARTTDQVAEQAQRYAQVRHHATALYEHLATETNEQDKHILKDLHGKLATMAVFDFEGAVALKNWDDLGHVVRKASFCRDETMLKAMGDCLLRSNAPGPVMFATMRLIINEIFTLEKFDNEKLSKYLRCIFQVILPVNDEMALQLVDESLKVAREGAQVRKFFPSAELEWLVATSFNHAIDFYARNEEGKCHQWALKAMDLATFMEDDGQYRDLLQDKFSKLRFGAQGR